MPEVPPVLMVVAVNGDLSTIPYSYENLRDTFQSKCFDRVVVNKDVDLWVDDEGLLIGEALNVPISMAIGKALYGPVVIAACTDQGDTVTCRDERFVELVSAFADQWKHVVESGAHYGQDVMSYADSGTVPPPRFVSMDEDWNPIPGTETEL